MMPSTHHFLATLFSTILLHSQVPPTSWTHSKIITLHKKGDHRDRKFSTYRSDISDRKVVSQDPSYQIGGFPDMQFDGGQIIAKRVPTRTKWLH